MRLKDETIVLTGAGRGIGSACALRYAREGAHVVLVGRSTNVEGVAGQIRQEGGSASIVIGDVSLEETNTAAVETAISDTGRLDGLHVNAAVQVTATLEDTTVDAWDEMERANLRAAYLASRAAIPHMRARNYGSILFTASVLASAGDPILPAYGAMKGGLLALCKGIATGYGDVGIRCNTVSPGDIETDMVAEYFDAQENPEHARREIADHYPLKRLGQPDDVAAASLFLLSRESAFVSGVDLLVDGGLRARIY